ncbi:hypothetical protein Prum_067650 [Phytohabitans rumicis]|uniref:Uncharacterized protein n=2 Tax=Phytohabitans rumicis TaxID=1076125 RepID=A0A6V8L782_9ACTN|nr:hypothetical protein Prum_067650 [Phytohabitans rumicis]
MATDMMAGMPGHDASGVEGPDEHFAVRVVARLLAALGQAMLFATVNQDHTRPQPRMDPRAAAEAVTGLSMAVYHTPPGDDLVTVAGEIVGWTRSTLEVFRDQLSVHAWSSCPCEESHGQDETDAAVLRAIRADLLLLPDPATRTLQAGLG